RRRRGAAGGIPKASNAKASNAKAPPRRSGPAAAEGRGSTPRGGPGRADRIADEIRRTARPGRSEAALAAFERAVGLVERDRDVGRDHEVRLWYVQADLLERSARHPEAITVFRRILRVEPDAFDVAERVAALEMRAGDGERGSRRQSTGRAGRAGPFVT